MTTKYLKKTKLLKLCCNLLNYDLNVPLKCVTYKFYRGTEWIEFCCNDYYYEICKMGNRVSITKNVFDDDFVKKEIFYSVFYIDISKYINTNILVIYDKFIDLK